LHALSVEIAKSAPKKIYPHLNVLMKTGVAIAITRWFESWISCQPMVNWRPSVAHTAFVLKDLFR
jgi:hypothetical protein